MQPLKNLPSLESLRVEGNPVCSLYPHAIDLLIAKLSPPIQILNGIKITQET